MSLAAKVLDALLPPLCLACDTPVTSQGALCPTCWGGMRFIIPPYCACCGMPFETPVGDGEQCAACLAEPPAYQTARAAMLYDDGSKKLILGLKHGDRTHLARTLGAWMARAATPPADSLIVPVPLHRWRLFSRRYNQAALLAQAFGRLAVLPVLTDALIRTRATPTQGHRNRKERAANVRGAFALNPRQAAAVRGRNVVLVDDVLTTGATVSECCRVLKSAGALEIHVVTLARVRHFT